MIYYLKFWFTYWYRYFFIKEIPTIKESKDVTSQQVKDFSSSLSSIKIGFGISCKELSKAAQKLGK